MVRILAVFFIVFVALFTAANRASADHNAYTNADVNMRTGPGSRYPIILTIPRGESVHVHTCLTYPNWCDVSWYGQRGFVHRRYLDGFAPQVYRDYVYPPPYVYPPRYVYPPYYRYDRDWYPDRYHEPRKKRKKYRKKKKRYGGYKKKRKSEKKSKKGSNKKKWKKKGGSKRRWKKTGKNKQRRGGGQKKHRK